MMRRWFIVPAVFALTLAAVPSGSIAAQSGPTLTDAATFLEQGRYDEAKAAATVVLQREPHSAGAYLVRGFSEKFLNEAAPALSDFNAALAINPQYERAFYGKCLALYDLHKLDDALGACSAAITLNPADAAVYQQRALTHDAKDDAANETIGLSDIDRAIELDPNNAWSFAERCELKLELKKYDTAMPDCDRSLALDESDSWTWYQRGRLYEHAGDYEHAASDYQKSIQTGPTITYAYCSLALAQNQIGESQEALSSANTCVDKLPKAGSAYLARAKVYAKIGNQPQALVDAKQALVLAQARKDAKTITGAQALIKQLSAPH